jgi:hypothetical protein
MRISDLSHRVLGPSVVFCLVICFWLRQEAGLLQLLSARPAEATRPTDDRQWYCASTTRWRPPSVGIRPVVGHHKVKGLVCVSQDELRCQRR